MILELCTTFWQIQRQKSQSITIDSLQAWCSDPKDYIKSVKNPFLILGLNNLYHPLAKSLLSFTY